MSLTQTITKIQQLVELINQESEAYYNTGKPLVGNAVYDMQLQELTELEAITGYIMSNSPTQHAGCQIVDKINKVTHNHPMLSLFKCHSVQDIIDFVNIQQGIMSVKLDGLTVSAEYLDGKLIKLETRGDGVEGGDILFHAHSFVNLPFYINQKGIYIIDGECVITTQDFEKINSTLSEEDKFANARNLAAGTLNTLDSSISKQRYLKFVAWDVIEGGSTNSYQQNLKEASQLGFEIVPLFPITIDNVQQNLDAIIELANTFDYPMDGAVIKFDDIAFGKSLGRTEKYFRSGIAYKYEDDIATTYLRDIEWSAKKTKITPVAVFDTVNLVGTEVNRASLHNVSIVKSLQLGIGDEITVYKSNMIIPQIKENVTKSNTCQIPKICPVCGHATRIEKLNESEELVCTNDNCKSKLLAKLSHFVSRKCMNIDGISEATLEKFIELGWLKTFSDIYSLPMRKEITKLDGFGTRSFEKMCKAIEASKNTTLQRLLYSLSIPNIGNDVSKKISSKCKGEFEAFVHLVNNKYDWSELEGIGEVINQSIYNYFSSLETKTNLVILKEKLIIEPDVIETKSTSNSTSLNGLTFVITGSISHFKNRDELKNRIEELCGKVSGSVSKNTSYLINNDLTSTSGKNKKMHELGLQDKIISEEHFMDMIGDKY